MRPKVIVEYTMGEPSAVYNFIVKSNQTIFCARNAVNRSSPLMGTDEELSGGCSANPGNIGGTENCNSNLIDPDEDKEYDLCNRIE